jgi:hypothetical protein
LTSFNTDPDVSQAFIAGLDERLGDPISTTRVEAVFVAPRRESGSSGRWRQCDLCHSIQAKFTK